MRYTLFLSSAILFLGLVSACKNTPKPDQTVNFEQSLLQLDKEMTDTNGVVINNAKANDFIKTAEEYAASVQATQPDKYADLLLKAAGVAKSIGNPTKALELYTAVTDKMPQHPKAPMALFMQGFILENDRGDTAAARVKYQDFLKKYPNDPDFTDDAQNALKFLGKSPEEMIKEFEKMNK